MKSNTNNCIIVHGCPSDSREEKTKAYAKHWMPWIKRELTSWGIQTEIPLMPEPWHPDYQVFKREFEKYIVDESTILIGHSCGSAFLVRWLGETKNKAKKLILVAPWKSFIDPNDQYRKKFYTYDIDETIRERVGSITMFTADDEDPAGKKSLIMFSDALGGKVIELKGRGHYTHEDMHTEEFPELVKEIIPLV